VALAALKRCDASIVDQTVEAPTSRNVVGQGSHLLEGGEVGAISGQSVMPALASHIFDRGVDSLLAAAVDEHGRAPPGELGREPPSEAVRGTGDQDRLLLERPHRRAIIGNAMKRPGRLHADLVAVLERQQL
jgi:hypothetical protein